MSEASSATKAAGSERPPQCRKMPPWRESLPRMWPQCINFDREPRFLRPLYDMLGRRGLEELLLLCQRARRLFWDQVKKYPDMKYEWDRYRNEGEDS